MPAPHPQPLQPITMPYGQALSLGTWTCDKLQPYGYPKAMQWVPLLAPYTR